MFRLRLLDDVCVRFVTNTTKESGDTLVNRLHRIGFTSIDKSDIFSSLSAAVKYVHANGLNPFYLLTEDAKKEFIGLTERNDTQSTSKNEDSVVIGLAPDKFNYESINEAFRYVFHRFKLLHVDQNNTNTEYSSMLILFQHTLSRILMKKDSQLIGIHEGKYYKQSDGLSVGPGYFTRGFEYTTGKKATIIGKPSPYFFNSAIPKNIAPHQCCMIGDVCV